jgi:hypothetical protein
MSTDSKGFFGLYRGTVFSNRDPLSQGRVKLRVPQVFADQTTGWAWGMSLPGVELVLPAVNQGVWVMFEGGNPSYPIWINSFGTSKLSGNHAYLPPVPKADYSPGVVVQTVRDKLSVINLPASVIELAELVEGLEEEVTTLSSALTDLEARVAALESSP